jgi:L-ribulose-5-phosphate 4-epimerase
MRSHGVFTIGGTAREAVKAAVMCEDAARTVHLARAFGDPLAPIPQEQIDALHRRYQEESTGSADHPAPRPARPTRLRHPPRYGGKF